MSPIPTPTAGDTAGDVISLCDRTGVAVMPWAEAGFRCWCIDIQHPVRRPRVVGNVTFAYGDARAWTPPPEVDRIAFVLAFPPCTNVAGSGAQDFKRKGLRLLTDALDLFNGCLHAAEWSRAPYVIENPVGVLSSHVRKPDYIVHPWEYAGYLPDIQTDNTSKATCLWTNERFVIPAKRPAPGPHREDCFMASPSDDRGDVRSVTPAGFARAVFEANAGTVLAAVA